MWQSIMGVFFTRPKYDILEEIPYGGVNKLFKIQDNHGLIYVLKLMPEGANVQQFLNLQRLENDHILKSIDWRSRIDDKDESLFKLPNNCRQYIGGFALIVEYCAGGDLSSLTDDISMDQRKQYAYQAISTINLIHSQNLIHRDIKPGNLLRKLNGSGQHILVVGDFDEAKESADISKTKTHTKIGTYGFEAPEIVSGTAGKARYSSKADAYSLGMTLINVFAPSSFNWSNWLKNFPPDWNEADLPEHIPGEYKMYIWGMTLFSTQDRLTVNDISICLVEDNKGIPYLDKYKIFIGGIWAVRRSLSQFRNELDRCMSDFSKTLTYVQTFDHGVHTPYDRHMKALMERAELDLGNISLDYNLSGLGFLEVRARNIAEHLQRYLLQLKTCWTGVCKLLELFKDWIRNTHTGNSNREADHLKGLNAMCSEFYDKRVEPSNTNDYYKTKMLDDMIIELIGLVEHVKKRIP